MKTLASVSAALMLTTTAATAGGLDRSGQGIGAIFEEGGYVELSFGQVIPDVSGSLPVAPTVALGSGNVGVDYSQIGFAFKQDVNPMLSFAFIYDTPFAADVAYDSTDAGYPLAGSSAEFRSTGITVLGRYKVNENVSIHAGARMVTIDANATVISPAGAYDATYDSDSDVGYVIGAAYERPDIALRVALTYSSATSFSHTTHVTGVPDAAVAPTEYDMPQSVNLDFQTGVAADTLVFGSIRWAEWSVTNIDSAFYPANPIVGHDNDSISYNIGVGRRFSDSFSGSVSIGHEPSNGGIASNLSPTDGNTSISVGGAYTLDNGVEVSGGVRYVWVGDADTMIGPGTANFTDNTAVGVGVKVAYNF